MVFLPLENVEKILNFLNLKFDSFFILISQERLLWSERSENCKTVYLIFLFQLAKQPKMLPGNNSIANSVPKEDSMSVHNTTVTNHLDQLRSRENRKLVPSEQMRKDGFEVLTVKSSSESLSSKLAPLSQRPICQLNLSQPNVNSFNKQILVTQPWLESIIVFSELQTQISNTNLILILKGSARQKTAFSTVFLQKNCL